MATLPLMPEKDERYYKAYLAYNTISRRSLLRAFVPHLAEEPKISSRTVPRPPSALNEAEFQSMCTGCGDCALVCPEQIILIENKHAQLSLSYGYCSQCGECENACKTGALSNKVKDTLLRPTFSNDCQNRYKGYCDLCVEQCPSGAISITENSKPILLESSCDGCGRCKQACPFSSVELALSFQP